MTHSQPIRVGARVEILQPEYVAGKIGVILAPEVIENQPVGDRWLVKVEFEDLILSLAAEDFVVL